MWRSMELARRFYCVCAVLLAFASRFHGVRAALPRRSSTVETRWKRRENSMDAVGTPWKRHGLPRRLHYDLTARPRSPRRVDEVLTALPRRPHGVPTELLLERRVMAFVLSMSKRNADLWRSRISHGVRWSSHRVATASMEFSRRSPWRSAFL